EASDAVVTCLPSPAAVAEVVARLLPAFRRGTVWIDMSTNDPHELVRLAELARAQGVETLEAPVTGGVDRAATGEITVLVGGDEAVFAAHREILEAAGGEIVYVGRLGSASTVKLITNLLALAHVLLIGEALM